jgi:hypothetical protein
MLAGSFGADGESEANRFVLPVGTVAGAESGEYVGEFVNGGAGELNPVLFGCGGYLDGVDGADSVGPCFVVGDAAVGAVTDAVDELGVFELGALVVGELVGVGEDDVADCVDELFVGGGCGLGHAFSVTHSVTEVQRLHAEIWGLAFVTCVCHDGCMDAATQCTDCGAHLPRDIMTPVHHVRLLCPACRDAFLAESAGEWRARVFGEEYRWSRDDELPVTPRKTGPRLRDQG